MNKKTKVNIFISILLSTVLSCSKSINRDYFYYRLIDELNDKNIITSPYKLVNKHLKRLNQQWDFSQLQPILYKGHKYYLASTKFPVFHRGQHDISKSISLRLDRKLIPYLEIKQQEKLSWVLKKGEKLFTEFMEKEKKTDNFPFSQAKKWKTDILLPEGLFRLDIQIKFHHLPRIPIKLKLFVNDKLSDETIIRNSGKFSLLGTARIGINEIIVTYDLINPEEKVPMSISQLFIKSQKDLLLLSIPEKYLHKPFKIYATYYPAPIDGIIPIRQIIRSNQSYKCELPINFPSKVSVEILGYSTSEEGILKIKKESMVETLSLNFSSKNTICFSIDPKKGKTTLNFTFFSKKNHNASFYFTAIIIRNPIKSLISLLAKLENTALCYDLGIKKNPYGLKKKIVIMNDKSSRAFSEMVTVIFAPPNSEYSFSLRLPHSTYLEFGYGVANQLLSESSSLEEEVLYKLTIEVDNKEKVLFEDQLTINPQETSSYLNRKIINLTSYGGKKVRLRFITSRMSFSPDKETIKPGLLLSYWENPTLYKSTHLSSNNSSPNVILISLDTLRADHLSCYGYPRQTTPNLEKLCSEAVLFANVFSTTSWTLPAHVSLLTGLDNRHHLVSKKNPYIETNLITLADFLRNNGYKTIAITGGGLVSARFGFAKGFESYIEYKNSHKWKASARLLFADFSQWLNKNKCKKFFAFLHTYQTHEPYFSPEPFNSMFFEGKKMPWKKANMQKLLFSPNHPDEFKALTPEQRENIIALYDGEIRFTDEKLIKPLINLLKSLKIYENTMIIFTSDHGEEFFERRAWLHGHSLYNELIHVPLIIKFPNMKYKNLRVTEVGRVTDIMPTILEVIGLDYNDNELDGKSLLSLLKGKKEDRISISDLEAIHYPPELPSRIAVYQRPFKFIINNNFNLPPEHFQPAPPPTAKFELYNIEKDPEEKQNIAQYHPKLVRQFIRLINKLYIEEMKKMIRPQKKGRKELEKSMRALGYIK
ncbi:MAG: hypothetical protein DRJ11_11240 [Candidatus Aminicenantes bacterium]|nr:MAG: hypothetical protein DRJ11_11240 [Candidatus Aminicenantes bacterium]